MSGSRDHVPDAVQRSPGDAKHRPVTLLRRAGTRTVAEYCLDPGSAAHRCALPVADQVIEQVEYLWRDGDYIRAAMQLAPVGVECVVLEELAQAANSLGGLRSSRLKHRLQRKE
jgi:hypothetical protein